MAYVQQSVIRTFRDDLFKKYQRLSLDYYHKRRTGSIISRVTNDVMVLNEAVDIGFNHLVINVISIIVSFILIVLFINVRSKFISDAFACLTALFNSSCIILKLFYLCRVNQLKNTSMKIKFNILRFILIKFKIINFYVCIRSANFSQNTICLHH